jgi:hypothetical protein
MPEPDLVSAVAAPSKSSTVVLATSSPSLSPTSERFRVARLEMRRAASGEMGSDGATCIDIEELAARGWESKEARRCRSGAVVEAIDA